MLKTHEKVVIQTHDANVNSYRLPKLEKKCCNQRKLHSEKNETKISITYLQPYTN